MGMPGQSPQAATAVRSLVKVKVASIAATYTHPEQSARARAKIFRGVAAATRLASRPSTPTTVDAAARAAYIAACLTVC